MNNIRITTRAVIFDGEKLLLARYKDDIYGQFYVCVGGGQEVGESMEQNIKRECLEEIGCEAEVGKFLFMRETTFIHAITKETVHQIEHYFSCKIKNGQTIKAGTVPDLTSDGFAFLTLDELKNVTVFPQNLSELVESNFKTQYLCEMP